MKLTPEQKASASAILRSNDESFLHLLRVAGLDPKRVLPGADLRGVVFTEHDDLTGLDLSGCDLRGTDLTRAKGREQALFDDVLTDASTRGLPPRRPPADFDLDQAKSMILTGQAPPRAWWPFITALSFVDEKAFRDVRPLAGLTALQTLDLRGTRVSDVTPLAGLTALQTLNLWGTRVSDVRPLAGLTALQTLFLVGTPVSDVTPLAGLTRLRSLDLTGAPVQDITPLRHLTNLAVNGYNQDAVGERPNPAPGAERSPDAHDDRLSPRQRRHRPPG